MPGHPELQVPAKRSHLQQMCETMRRHHTAMRQQDQVIAVVMRKSPGLRNLIGRTGAYRVARQFSHAAALNTEAANAYRRAYDIYMDARARKQQPQRSFTDD